MKSLFIALFTTGAFNLLNAQVNTNSINVPNSGANTTVPPTQTNPQPTLSNPSNSTVPGANGSYSVDLSKPEFTNPNTQGAYTVYPNATPGSTTYSPQTGTNSDKKKRSGK